MQSTLLLLLFCGIVWSQNQTCSNPLNVATFNTLQINFAPYRDRRLDAAIDYFRTRETDLTILCMQELWDVDQRTQVVNDLRGQYPHSYAANPVQTTCNGGCRGTELDSIRSCIDRNDCFSFSSSQFTDCIRAECRGELEAVGASCATCLQSGDSVGDIFRNLDNCLSDDNIDPSQQCFAYEGQSDNLLLSTIPFDSTDTLYFADSPITVTTALYGRLTTSIGVTHVVCTHLLPADLPVFTFENITNLNQSTELLRWVSEKVGNNSEPIILLGDFNHGPGFWPDNYDYVIQSGYTSAYTSAGNTNCTYCNSNPLSMGDTSFIIDHVYLDNAYHSNSRRFGTYYEYSLDSSSVSFLGDRIPISDHYGVRAAVCAGESSGMGVLSSQVRVTDTDTFPGRDDSSSAASIFASIATLLLIALLM